MDLLINYHRTLIFFCARVLGMLLEGALKHDMRFQGSDFRSVCMEGSTELLPYLSSGWMLPFPNHNRIPEYSLASRG